MKTISVLGVVSSLIMLVCFPVLAADSEVSPHYPPDAEVQVPEDGSTPANQVPAEEISRIGVATPSGKTDFASEGPGNPFDALRMEDVGEGREPNILWGTDVLVRDGRTPTWGDLSLDHAEDNGDLYVALLVPGGGGSGDTVEMYRSTDNGVTWVFWDFVRGTPSTGGLDDVELIVGPGANPWIYTFLLQDAASGGVRLRRRRANFSAFNWYFIETGGDTISDISADRSIGASMNLFVSYIAHSGATDRLWVERSTDEGATWVDPAFIASGDRRTARVSSGGDGYFYITYAVDTTTIRIARNDNNLSGSWAFNDVATDAEGDWRPWVSGARTTPGSSQAAWVLWRHRHSGGNADLHVAYSTNGGATWTEEAWPPTNTGPRDRNMDYACIKYPYDYSVPLCVATAVLYGESPSIPDSVITVFSRASTPDVWEDKYIINDWDATGEFGPRIDMTGGIGGTGIVYRRWGSGEVYFDYWWNVGVEERVVGSTLRRFVLAQSVPNPFKSTAVIPFTIPSALDVDLSVYDVTGRTVATLASGRLAAGDHSFPWDGKDSSGRLVSSGIYFYRLTAGNFTSARKMILLR